MSSQITDLGVMTLARKGKQERGEGKKGTMGDVSARASVFRPSNHFVPIWVV
jgi:hypothetical protein